MLYSIAVNLFLLSSAVQAIRCFQGSNSKTNVTIIECEIQQNCLTMKDTIGNVSQSFFDCDQSDICSKPQIGNSRRGFIVSCCQSDLCNFPHNSTRPNKNFTACKSAGSRLSIGNLINFSAIFAFFYFI